MIEIIAEIGKNFVISKEEESLDFLLERAKRLVDLAKDVGCDMVKFQVHNVEDEIHPDAHIVSPHFDHDRYAWVRRNTYPVAFWWKIKEHCREAGIEFLATPMSRGAAELLDETGVDRWKIGSGDILDFVMLDYIRNSGKPVILSSGMSSLEELQKSYDYLREKTPDVSILHCVSQYPCPLSSLNLNTIPFLKKQFPEATIGLSDHSVGIEGPLMAVSLGANIIEKHFTFDRSAWGPDHKVSLHPDEMKELVRRIRVHELMEPTREVLGVETKYLQRDEEQFRSVFRKGLYASRDIREGEVFEPDMLVALRPCMNTTPSESYPEVLGTLATKSIKKYEAIT